jgi:CheY-like chemotaxis protein
MALVLCTGVDQSLLQTRKLILEKAGHTVVTATDERDVISACQKNEFDVAVIGQTVSVKIKPKIAEIVRQHCPKAKVLELYQSHAGKALDDADSWLLVPSDVPAELADRVSELAGGRSN